MVEENVQKIFLLLFLFDISLLFFFNYIVKIAIGQRQVKN